MRIIQLAQLVSRFYNGACKKCCGRHAARPNHKGDTAMTLNRWAPYTEMVTLRGAMNRLMEDAIVRPGRVAGTTNGSARQVPMDIYETPQELVIRAALPGFSPDQVQISF